MDKVDQSHVAGLREDGVVTASFRALSAPLSRQSDFVGALAAARRLEGSCQEVLDAAHAGT